MTVEGREPGWKTYLKSGLFLGPGILACAFVAVFILPKLKQIWRDASLIDSNVGDFQGIMDSVTFALEKMGMILLLSVVVLVALEFTGDLWRRHRRLAVGILVFLLNAAIIAGLVGACLVAAIAGPALMKPH